MSSSYSISSLFSVKGKIVLVTGGGTGIGLYIAKGLATNGAKVYIGGRREAVLEAAAKEFKGEGSLIPVEIDVTDKASVLRAVQTIDSAEGKLDVLVNNAGVWAKYKQFYMDPSSPELQDTLKLGGAMFDADSFKDFSDVFDADVSSIYFVTAAFLALLQKASRAGESYSASVINISSMVAFNKLSAGFIEYVIAKGAVNHLTKVLAADFAYKNLGVRVNALAPGAWPSELTRSHIAGPTMTGEEATKMTSSLFPIPANRGGKEEEIAAAAIFLSSPATYYMNGQILSIDGGYTLLNPSTY